MAVIKIILKSGTVIEVYEDLVNLVEQAEKPAHEPVDDKPEYWTSASSVGLEVVSASTADNSTMPGAHLSQGCGLVFVHPVTGLNCSMAEYNQFMEDEHLIRNRIFSPLQQ